MPHVHVEASAMINARPDVVYSIIRDYNEGHPRILPEQNFSNLRVEEGSGVGAGTVISFVTKVGGGERSFRARIEEPEPGRVLVERDLNSDTVTTFTVYPADNNNALVKITTDWTASSGVRGVVEKMLAPSMLSKVYEAELRKLNEVAASRPSKEKP